MSGEIHYGMISSVSGDSAEVICPGMDNEVTASLPLLSAQHDRYIVDSQGKECPVMERYKPGQWVVIVVEGNDVNTGVILT